ncbi:MAG TPA: nuclear transport factor 2 family protein [Acidobacteriaceae bacterium]|nr:nuclear transport factor 2 family protein [Acidobacteriaceae bacterium]
MTPQQVFASYADAWNRHDADGIVATFADGGTYCDPTTPGPLTGAAIGEYASGLWSAFPDLSFQLTSAMGGRTAGSPRSG